jgi:hypothetical protein
MLNGFIDPNSPLFAPYSTDLPNFYDRSSSNVTGPDGSTNDMGAPVFTSGSVTAAGNIVTNSTLLLNRPLVEPADGNITLVTTLTGNSCLNSIIRMTPSIGRTFTLPATTALIAVLGSTVGVSFEFIVINLSGANTITIAAGDGNTTIAGSNTVAVSATARYIVRLASATTVIVYRA